MNEKIRQIAKAAEFEVTEDYQYIFAPDPGEEGECSKQLARFAQLIIKECEQQCEQHYAGAIGTYAGAHNTAVKKCIESIKQHFGVEE